MDAESAREFLLTLPHVVETQQWGDNLVFWVGDKAVGGKMFCLVNLDGDQHGVVSYAAGADAFHERVEREGMKPAPYFGRIFWISAERWDVLGNRAWQQELRAAHAMTLAKLTKRTLEVLALPPKERAQVVAARRKVAAAKKSLRS